MRGAAGAPARALSGPARAQVGAAFLLAPAAGAVDAVSYVVLHQIFTANMTGNSTLLGLSLGGSVMRSAVPIGVAVAIFLVAMALGTVVLELAMRNGERSAAGPVFALEIALLSVYMIYGGYVLQNNSAPDYRASGFYVLLAVAVFAMGLQTASLTRALGTSVHTTFVSALLLNAAQELVHAAMPEAGSRSSYLRDELQLGARRSSLQRAGFHLGVWAAFVAGAVWGSYAESRWQLWALALPLGLLAVAFAVDLWRPLHVAGRPRSKPEEA